MNAAPHATPANAGDALHELRCRVVFLRDAAWAFTSLGKYDSFPGPEAWEGLGYLTHDMLRLAQTVTQDTTTP